MCPSGIECLSSAVESDTVVDEVAKGRGRCGAAPRSSNGDLHRAVRGAVVEVGPRRRRGASMRVPEGQESLQAWPPAESMPRVGMVLPRTRSWLTRPHPDSRGHTCRRTLMPSSLPHVASRSTEFVDCPFRLLFCESRLPDKESDHETEMGPNTTAGDSP